VCLHVITEVNHNLVYAADAMSQVNQNDFDQETGVIKGSILNHIVNLGYINVEGVRQVTAACSMMLLLPAVPVS
jgi:hypothetical protein